MPICSSDMSQSAPLKSITIASKSWSSGKKTGVFPGFQCFLTYKRSTDTHGADSLTVWREAFRAKISAQQEREQASKANDLVCGMKWRELSVKYDLDSCAWRTAHCSSSEVLPWSSVILPKWGMMRNGACWEHAMWALPIKESASGFWPTPQASETHASTPNCKMQWMLTQAAKSGCKTRKEYNKHKLATPKSRDWKGQSQRGIHAPGDALPNTDRGDGKPIGGQLNPDWDELVMGWPCGWTSLVSIDPQEMKKWIENTIQDEAWPDDSWERDVPRLVEKISDRHNRIKAIGNGQVPLCAALAWMILSCSNESQSSQKVET